MSDSLRPHELQHARPPCPSPTPGVYPNLCPLSWWCHPAISSTVIPSSSSCPLCPNLIFIPPASLAGCGARWEGTSWHSRHVSLSAWSSVWRPEVRMIIPALCSPHCLLAKPNAGAIRTEAGERWAVQNGCVATDSGSFCKKLGSQAQTRALLWSWGQGPRWRRANMLCPSRLSHLKDSELSDSSAQNVAWAFCAHRSAQGSVGTKT